MLGVVCVSVLGDVLFVSFCFLGVCILSIDLPFMFICWMVILVLGVSLG